MARGGSRGGDRGDGPGADAAGPRDADRAAGADAGAELDAAADEPRLQAMRAVWLEMRDQAPPARGMAELLAAARRKAEAMQPGPTLWQRLLAATRRPAVLALATAVVLIGGALVVGRRVSDRPDALPAGAAGETARLGDPAADPRDGARAPESQRAVPGTGAGISASPAVTTEAPSAAPASRTEAPSAAPASSVLPAPPQASGKPSAAPAPAADMTPTVPGAHPERVAPAHRPRPAQLAAEPRAEPPPPPPPRAPAANDDSAARTEVRDRGAEAALGSSGSPKTARERGSAPAPAVDPSGSTSTGPGDRDDDAAPPARSRGPAPSARLAQLYRDCKAAASRGDCAAVRRLVDLISERDRGYRARIGKDSAVGRCLAE
jgi:hypothetical protein